MSLERISAYVLTVGGALGVFASLMLSIEEFHHLKNPSNPLSCDLNPLIGCGSILDTWQGHVFLGIPNQFLGLAAFSVLTAIGVFLLAKVKFPSWIWRGLQAGAVGGMLFVLWFMYESLFVLNHLCPYCMVTWVATVAVAWYITVRNVAAGNCMLIKPGKVADFITKHHADIIVGVYVFAVLGVLFRFRDFFFGS